MYKKYEHIADSDQKVARAGGQNQYVGCCDSDLDAGLSPGPTGKGHHDRRPRRRGARWRVMLGHLA